VQFAHYLKFRDLIYLFFCFYAKVNNFELWNGPSSSRVLELELELGQHIFLREPVSHRIFQLVSSSSSSCYLKELIPDRQYSLRIDSFIPLVRPIGWRLRFMKRMLLVRIPPPPLMWTCKKKRKRKEKFQRKTTKSHSRKIWLEVSKGPLENGHC